MFKKVLLTGAVCGLACGFVARADTIGQSLTFTLTEDGCTHACGTSTNKVFGTVTLTYNGTGVNVLETLNPGSAFADTAGDSLAFDLKGTSINITGLSSDFAVVGGTDNKTTKTWSVAAVPGGTKSGIHEAPFGYYDYAVTCGGVSCGPGASATDPGPLSFTISGVTLEDFSGETSTYGDVFFSTDIIGPSGKTGDVGAVGPGTPSAPPTVPEPSSLALLGTGALGLAGVIRRRFGRA